MTTADTHFLPWKAFVWAQSDTLRVAVLSHQTKCDAQVARPSETTQTATFVTQRSHLKQSPKEDFRAAPATRRLLAKPSAAAINTLNNRRAPSSFVCVCGRVCRRTCWKQLRTLGSMLEPPKAATSPSCLGIWMASWSSRPSCRWSHVSPADATWLKRPEQGGKVRKLATGN